MLSSFIDWLMGKGGGSVCGKLSRGQQATVSANQHRSISSVLVHDGSIRAHTVLTTAADAVFICLYYIFIRGNNYIYFSFLKTNCRVFSENVSGVRKKKKSITAKLPKEILPVIIHQLLHYLLSLCSPIQKSS